MRSAWVITYSASATVRRTGSASPGTAIAWVIHSVMSAGFPSRNATRLSHTARAIPRGVFGVTPVAQRGEDVIAIVLHHSQPGELVPGQQLRPRLGHEVAVVPGVAPPHLADLG